MKTIIFANLSEPMKEVISYINEMIQEAGGFEQVANDIANSVVDGISMAVDAAEFLYKSFNAISGVVEAIIGGIALVARGILEIVEFATKMPGTPLWFADKDGSISKNIESMQSGLDGMISRARTYEEIIADVADKNEKASQFSSGLKSRLESGREKMNINHDAKMEAPKLEGEIQSLEKALNDATRAFIEAQASGKDSTAEFTAKQAAQDALDAAKASYSKAYEQLNPRNFGKNDAGSTKEQYLANELHEKQKKDAQELEKQQRELLKQQKQAQSDKLRLDRDAAKLNQDSSKYDRQSSEVMRQAADNISRSLGSDVVEKTGSMSYITGSQAQDSQSIDGMKNLGVLYIASQDGAQMAKVLATPESVQVIKQIAIAGVRDYARSGSAANS